MRPSRSRRRWVLLPLAALAFAACGAPAAPATSPPASTTTTTRLPPATEPVVTEARLRAILLRASDLPPGFGADGPGVGRDTVTRLQLCGQPVVATRGAVTTADVAFVRADDQVSELLMSFASPVDADRAVAQLASVVARCPVDGPLVIKPVRPPAVGEAVAGVQFTNVVYETQVVIVRSGAIDAVVVVSGRTPSTPGTWMAVVTAVGTALAVGTGG